MIPPNRFQRRGGVVLPISRGRGRPQPRGPNRTGTHGVVGTNPARLQRRYG